jgi:uncharacterized membrane protein
MNTSRLLAIPVMALSLSFATQSFAQTYTYTQIDAPNSSLTRPFGINSHAQIVGLSRDGDGTPHGFLRDTDGTYLKFEYPGASFTNAMGINDQGVIVGSWADSKGNNHTYLRSPAGVFSNFDPPAPCFPSKDQTRGRWINNHGDIVGRCFAQDHQEYGWMRHSDGTFQILTGSGLAGSDAYFAPDGGQYIAGGDCGNLGGDYSNGKFLTGEGVGRKSVVHGVLWDRNGGFATLDVLNSPTALRGMNSSGDITGAYIDVSTGLVHGFLLRNGIVINIDFPNSNQNGDNIHINDLGVIVGGFIDAAGVEHGFIATCSGEGC